MASATAAMLIDAPAVSKACRMPTTSPMRRPAPRFLVSAIGRSFRERKKRDARPRPYLLTVGDKSRDWDLFPFGNNAVPVAGGRKFRVGWELFRDGRVGEADAVGVKHELATGPERRNAHTVALVGLFVHVHRLGDRNLSPADRAAANKVGPVLGAVRTSD